MGKNNQTNLGSNLFVSSRQFFLEMVDEGFSNRKMKSDLLVKNYLVGMLEYYLDARNLFDFQTDQAGQKTHPTLAEMYLKANTLEFNERRELLKRLADKSLYISGFFGDSLQRKLVDVDYYARMGGAAYGSLAESIRDKSVGQVYRVFSKRFIEFVDVLTYISQKAMVQTDSNVLRLYENYLRTGSELAKERLMDLGVIMVTAPLARAANQD